MGERKGTKGLELWCRKMTEGYPGVKIENMTTSWRDGLAFCAIIHHFRPDLIDFDKLNKADIYQNNELAFTVAEHHLGIPALLEPEDMVEYEVPDRLSILTYLSQYYQTFESQRGKSGARAAQKRPQTTPDHGIVSPQSTSPPSKVQITIGRSRREPCAKCGLPVFIAERLNVGKLLYHRTCFRCARCKSQLSLANYYETENGEFCCEICPDEERAISKKIIPESVLNRSLSDEEKTASLQSYADAPDAYSTHFESALENSLDVDLKKSSTLKGAAGSEFTKARSSFFQSQLDSSTSEGEVETAPPVKPKPPLSPKPNLELLRKRPQISSVSNSFLISRTKNDSDIHSISVSEQTNDRFVTKDNNPSSPTEMSVRARMKLFENDKEDKSDVNNTSRSSSESPLVTKKAVVIAIDDLEDFDNISNKKNFEVEDHPEVLQEEADDAHSVIDDLPSDTLEEKSVEAKNDHITINSSIVTIPDSSSENINSAEVTHITIDDSPVVNYIVEAELTRQTEEVSFLSAQSNISCTTPSSEDIPVRRYFTTYEIPLSPSNDIENGVPESIQESPELNVSQNEEKESKPEVLTPNQVVDYPEELDPFSEEDPQPPILDEAKVLETPPPPILSKKKLIALESNLFDTSGPVIYVQKISINPFEDLSDKEDTPGSSYNPFEEEDDKPEEKIVPKPRKKIIPAFKEAPPKGYNPFEEDEDEPEADIRAGPVPVPTPRLSKANRPEPKPRDSLSVTSRGSHGGSTSSISSGSAFGSARKKKPAPRPPVPFGSPEYPDSLVSSPPSSMSYSSPNLSGTIRSRKSKRAPLPPTCSTPFNTNQMDAAADFSLAVSPVMTADQPDEVQLEKNVKNEENKTLQQKQDLNLEDDNLPHQNKSAAGRWKRRKGQAPSRPIPERRIVKSLPLSEIKRELDTIEIQQQGLEKQGVRLEQIIREKCEGPEGNAAAASFGDQVPIEVEDMILQLFELVNEKNELFRRQTELMYLRRQQRLEEEYADVEYQIRCLILEPDSNKSDSDKLKEEILLNRLVEIVEMRNEIVECLEMDRKREAEEDNSISSQLNLYTAKRDGDKDSSREDEKKDKKKKLKKINKLMSTFKHKKEKDRKVDADKDVDESETNANLEKRKKKLKWPL